MNDEPQHSTDLEKLNEHTGTKGVN
jgi:hypothetical protein